MSFDLFLKLQSLYNILKKGKGKQFVFQQIIIWSTSKLQKGGVPATPSGTATLLRLNTSY